MGQTHSISGLKWKPDSESFLPSTIRIRDNPSEHQSVSFKEVAIKWSAAPDMTPQTVLYRRPVA
ncbi:hypothetical protein RNP45_17735, partial [Escherichia coli]|nr:hypothetical protein [Escherichia coli]